MSLEMFLSRVILCLLVSAPAWGSPNSLDLEDLWDSFKLTHRKQYTSQEEKSRRLAWEANIDIINKHNLEADLGRHTYRLGLNKYADLTSEEYKKLLTGGTPDNRTSGGATYWSSTNEKLPDEVDWRKQGYVTAVQDQGMCGSSWAFAANGAVEGQHFKATGKLVPLSAQNLVDCSKPEGNDGCSGGKPYKAYKYIIKNQGVDTNASYPYTAKDTQPCAFKPANVGATLRGYLEIPSGNENALQQIVAGVGPVSVSIDSSHDSFHLYQSGVYSEPQCSSTYMDLGLLVVGYGVTQGQAYWLVKNNWGTSWGIQGYVMIARNKNNMCAIATEASYPVV